MSVAASQSAASRVAAKLHLHACSSRVVDPCSGIVIALTKKEIVNVFRSFPRKKLNKQTKNADMFYGLLSSYIFYWFLCPLEMSNAFVVMKCQHDFVRQPLYCGRKKLQ
jgi:hypothetical protein